MLWIVLPTVLFLVRATPVPLLDESEEMDEPCFPPCYCEVKEGLFHVHCDAKGFSNISQVSQSWLRPFKLYLQKNNLRKLYFNSFLHLNSALALNLGNNALQDIQPGAFHGLASLRRLYLHENKLEVFRNDTFLGLDSLEYLQADYNLIRKIESGAFRHLHKLRVLILNDNLIPVLPALLFRSVSLTHLDLRGNRLRSLSYRGALEYMGRNLMEIQLEENPWNCACEIVELQAWLERIPYTALVGEITCEYPFHLHGKDLREIKRAELCPSLTDAQVEASLGIPHTHGRARPTKPSSMFSGNKIQDTPPPGEHKERHTKPTRRPRPSKTPPTRSVLPNHPPIAGYETRPPIPVICPLSCTCKLHINDLGLTVNCKEIRLRNVSELTPRPLNAKKLYLSGNLIQRIHRSDFWNFSSLELLHLGNNQIFYVQDGAFMNLPNLRSLYLNGNRMEKLTPDMFHGLHSLRYLYFEYNIITEIHPAAFRSMSLLQLLFLNNNQLRSLPAGTFQGTTLARLNLRGNYFLSLRVDGVLDHLSSVVQIDLNQNPWDCSCTIVPFKQWLDTLSSVVVVGEVLCETPDSMVEKELRLLSVEAICPEMARPSSSPDGRDIRFSPSLPLTPVIPLSVLVLSLIVLFVSSFFAAAALCAFMIRRRGKLPFRKQDEAGLTGIQMECGIFPETPPNLPETPPSNHVYESITATRDSTYRVPPEKTHDDWSSVPISTVSDIVGFRGNTMLCPTVIDSQGPTPRVGLVHSLFGATPWLGDSDPDASARTDQTQSEYLGFRSPADHSKTLEHSYQF